jgi:hypothetical protein
MTGILRVRKRRESVRWQVEEANAAPWRNEAEVAVINVESV